MPKKTTSKAMKKPKNRKAKTLKQPFRLDSRAFVFIAAFALVGGAVALGISLAWGGKPLNSKTNLFSFDASNVAAGGGQSETSVEQQSDDFKTVINPDPAAFGVWDVNA